MPLKTLYVGWEDGNLLLNGADTMVQLKNDIVITWLPVQLQCALPSPHG